MTTTDNPELRDALAVMLRLIEDRSSFERNAEKHSEKLGELLQRVENLKAELPEDAPEMLRHFLEKRSYTKAFEFLMNQMTPEEQAAWKPAC